MDLRLRMEAHPANATVCLHDAEALHPLAVWTFRVARGADEYLWARLAPGQYVLSIVLTDGPWEAKAGYTFTLPGCQGPNFSAAIELAELGAGSIGQNVCHVGDQEVRGSEFLLSPPYAPPGSSGEALTNVSLLWFGGGSVALGLLGLAMVRFRYALLGSFTRLARPQIATHPVREVMLALIKAQPAINPNQVAKQLGLGQGQTAYHLGVLRREGLILVLQPFGRKHLFITGAFSEQQALTQVVQRTASLQGVWAAVGHEPTSLRTVAREAGVSLGQASKMVRRLEAMHLIMRLPDGRAAFIQAPRR